MFDLLDALTRLLGVLEERGLRATGTAYATGTVQLTISRGDPETVELALGAMTDGLVGDPLDYIELHEEEG